MISDVANLVSDNLDLWTSAIERKSGAGRGGGKKVSHYGIERLRALILDLAVRGKLVPQDARDEPARSFLARLKVKPSGRAVQDLHPGWCIATLADLGTFVGGLTPSKAITRYWGPGYAWVSPKDMGADFVDDSEDQITQTALDETSLQVVPAGSLLLVARSGILRRKLPLAINRIPCTLNQDMKALVVKPEVNPRYLQVMLQGFQPRILTDLVKTGMTVESLIFKAFTSALWPIPPLAEQHRIVAKVDQLMALCDALEAESASALEAHQTVVETLLGTLVSATDPADLVRQWTRLETHFHTLFTTQISVKQLRLTILNLAVRGQLSHPSDWLPRPVKLGSVARLQNGYAFRSEWFSDVGVRLLRNINIGHDDVDWTELACLSDDMAREYSRFRLNVGDVVLTLDRPFISTGTKVARIKEADLPALLLQRVARFQLSEKILPEFVYLWVCSPLFSEQIDPGRSNGVPHISTKQVEAAAIFVPDVAEQRRIVAKVDELMGLCDALEAGVADGEQTRKRLADAIVERAAA